VLQVQAQQACASHESDDDLQQQGDDLVEHGNE
jgi:hypothetical protein